MTVTTPSFIIPLYFGALGEISGLVEEVERSWSRPKYYQFLVFTFLRAGFVFK